MPDKQTNQINKEDIAKNPDRKIDQDFEGYPHGSARDETIKPSSEQEEKSADIDNKDGEKQIIRPADRKGLDEQESDGSANAFDDK